MAATTLTQEERISHTSAFAVSAADGSMAMFQGIVGQGTLTYYFTSMRGLEFGPAALVWLIFGLWNAVNDPLFGYISDRTKSVLGRRIPYIRYGAPLITLAFIACWIGWPTPELTPYAGGEWWTSPAQLSMFFQFLAALFLYDTLWTAIATSIYIMPYEMAVSNRARSAVFAWKVPFGMATNFRSVGRTIPGFSAPPCPASTAAVTTSAVATPIVLRFQELLTFIALP